MARTYRFYALNAKQWLSRFGSKDRSLLESLRYAKRDTDLVQRLIFSERKEDPREPEPADVRYYSEQLLVLDREIEEGPEASSFLYALTQATAGGGTSIDGVSLARSKQAKEVCRHLGLGRGVIGRPDVHNAYGYLQEAEVPALLEVVRSAAWKAYLEPTRYRPSAVKQFERDRSVFDAWLVETIAAGRDLYFAATPIRGLAAAKKRAPGAKRVAARTKKPRSTSQLRK